MKRENFSLDESYNLIYRILRYANLGISRIEFLRETSKMLINFSKCDLLEIKIKERDKYLCCNISIYPDKSSSFKIMPCPSSNARDKAAYRKQVSDSRRLSQDMMNKHFLPSHPYITERGSFWTCNTNKSYELKTDNNRRVEVNKYFIDGEFNSLAIIPIIIGEEKIGIMQFKSRKRGFFTKDLIKLYENIAQNIGIAVIDRQTQMSLRERVKELTCLYNITKLIERPGKSFEDKLTGIIELLPPALLCPDLASAKIYFDGNLYISSNYQHNKQNLNVDIIVDGKKRGYIEVTYKKKMPELDFGPFLKEELNLLEAVAKQLILVIEGKHAEEEKLLLQDQLRHADRLATIGQLAAGVAHELNEPLSNILGFSQLITKSSDLPIEIRRDIDKIIKASLHSREIIQKLQLFARQMPPNKIKTDLNQVVEEGLFFLESRCVKGGIELIRMLSPVLPEIIADPGQLHQVLVNLIVNAIQAMPDGGRLTVQTVPDDQYVCLIVVDTGEGMSENTMKQIFIPFFTTKDVGQGTGLGLAVVHGIIASHGGSINVESTLGSGTRFEIKLPVIETEELDERSDLGSFS